MSKRRRKSHEQALIDIKESLVSVDDPPRYVFAAVVYSETSDYTASARDDASPVDLFEALATHVNVIADATGEEPDDVIDIIRRVARNQEKA